jgi:accessory gene regulator protein AgrB
MKQKNTNSKNISPSYVFTFALVYSMSFLFVLFCFTLMSDVAYAAEYLQIIRM